MSDLNLDNIVGFKAVDKDGNEQNVTVDDMVDMVSTRMVMALSETSTFAAAAATGNDVYENELPTASSWNGLRLELVVDMTSRVAKNPDKYKATNYFCSTIYAVFQCTVRCGGYHAPH